MRPLRLLFLGARAVAVGLAATIAMAAANPTTAQTASNPKPQTIPAQ
ncbi:hypothetical protein OHA79_03660 [Streptomyces sp. NBC_00841]|nr:hypothetical protein [Streptomyces sp. NBC_00841]WRZ97093.1 hypothetical protein OHA79_03660 [Streptomyces sp. NBC_00841]